MQAWLRVALPLYTQSKSQAAAQSREKYNPETSAWFNRPGGEARTFNFLDSLRVIRCPTLVLGGTMDPMTPIECQRDIAAALPPSIVEYHEFPNCGHGVIADEPTKAMAVIRQFIAA